MLPTSGKLKVLFAAAMAVAFIPLSAAQAQDSCDVKEYAGPPDGCHEELITASGRLRPFENAFPSARVSARKAWERQALTKFGERFKVWDNAVCAKTECVPGSIAGMKRCTYSGYACAPNKQLASETTSSREPLSDSEVRELQSFLRKAGIRRVRIESGRRDVKVDGEYGPVTHAAIAEFIERENIDDSNLTERDILEMVRKRYG
ncbi:MAG: peptidoglycan-binding protein [Alphaproteobacteria bacterium]|nr:peptidoglycan-binding protein [Alphaproteobacteria bacterium]